HGLLGSARGRRRLRSVRGSPLRPDRARGRGPRDPRTVDLAGLRVRGLLGRPAGGMASALHTALEPAEPAAYLRGVRLPLLRTDGRTARFLRLRLRGGGAAREQMLASLPLGQARLDRKSVV